VIIVFACFLLFSLYLGLAKPNAFIILYLLATTKFLGFVDIEQMFVFGGTGLGMPSLNSVTFLTAFIQYTKKKVPWKYHLFIFCFLLFFLYGIILPVFLNYESIYQAFITSKESWTISLLLYLASYRKTLNERLIITCIKNIGLYLTFLYLFFIITSISPPCYYASGVFKAFYPTYISFALFLLHYDFQIGLVKFKKMILLSIFLFIGLMTAGHFSLVIGTATSLIIYYCVYKNSNFSVKRLFIRTIIIIYSFLLLFFSSNDFRETITTQVTIIATGEDDALKSRDSYNLFRLNAIADRPLTGYGFIHKSAPITKKYQINQNNRFSERFSVIDSGYIDLLIKFGSIGTSLYLLFWGYMIYKVLKNSTKHNPLQLLMAFYILQYFPVNFTWSVLTYSHGLVPAFIATYFILKKNITFQH